MTRANTSIALQGSHAWKRGEPIDNAPGGIDGAIWRAAWLRAEAKQDAKNRQAEPARQREALREGRQAEDEGRPVIYIHGRPYADPADDPQPPARSESPFPWDLWDEM